MLCTKVIEVLRRWEEGQQSMEAASRRVEAAERALAELIGPSATTTLLTLLRQEMRTCITCDKSKPEGVFYDAQCIECETSERAKELAQ